MEEKIKNIKKLLELNGSSRSNEQSALTIISSIKHLVPNFKEENVKPDDIKDIIDEIQDQLIPIYDKYFSNDEIVGIIEFYKTSVGQSYLNKMGRVAIESMEVGNKYGEIVYKRLMEISGTEDVNMN